LSQQLKYQKSLDEIHNVDYFRLFIGKKNHFKKFGCVARGSQSATVHTDNLASFLVLQPGDATSEANMSRLIGIFGRLAYNYDNKYYLGGSIRRDGSSKFGKNNKWGLFPTVSGGWSMHKEGFLSDVSWLSQMKLRASYGVSGNQAFGSYFSKTIYEPTDVVINPGTGESVLTWSASRNANPDLKWERTAEVNLGIDFGFFSDKINGTLEVYNKHTTDMLNEYSVPSPPAKYNKTWDNRGEMTNKGIELYITAFAVDMEKLDWKTTVGFSKNVGKITDLGEGWNENDSKKGYISGQGIVGSDNWTM
jgi:iron complex outermembrane receptor protein